MFIMFVSNYHSYTHLILALGIVRKPIVWVFINLEYPGIHDIGLPSLANNRTPYSTKSDKTAFCERIYELHPVYLVSIIS